MPKLNKDLSDARMKERASMEDRAGARRELAQRCVAVSGSKAMRAAPTPSMALWRGGSSKHRAHAGCWPPRLEAVCSLADSGLGPIRT